MTEPKEFIDHMRKVLSGEIEKIDYEDLEDFISFEGFSYAHGEWHRGEAEILQPQLQALGYTEIEWSMGEYDTFGPLTRVCKARGPSGELHWFVYG